MIKKLSEQDVRKAQATLLDYAVLQQTEHGK